MAPRKFERPAVIALSGEEGAQGLALEGLFVPSGDDASHGAVIAPPHPLYGGSMDSPVVTEIAHACARADTCSLRFNWRGVGGSGGQMSGDAEVGVADYCAALSFLEETVEGPLVACGYSFGAATAVQAAASSPRVQRLLLVAPPPAMLAPGALESFGGKLFVAVGDRDEFAPAAELEELTSRCSDARFDVIPDTDPFFMTSLAEVGRLATDWLERGAR
jgi:alpha/beta superfamily hydrolase